MARLIRFRVVATALAVLLIASGGLALAAARSSAPKLAPIGPDRLLASVIRAIVGRPPVSGMLVSHVAVGLPTLPDGGRGIPTGGLTDLLGYVNGDHRIHVWSSKDGFRASELLQPAAEISYVANARRAWAWVSEAFTAYRLGLPPVNPFAVDPASALPWLDPERIARTSIAGLSPTTLVRLGAPLRVAGRPAYALDLVPRTPGTLVGRVELDVDARSRVPLAARVFARGAGSPSLSVAYRSVRFGPIDPATFTFTPPPGARIVDVKPPSAPHRVGPMTASPDLRLVGSGWAAVAAVPIPSLRQLRSQTGGVDPGTFLPISGALFSVRLAERAGHGWLLAGFVPQSRLRAVAATLP